MIDPIRTVFGAEAAADELRQKFSRTVAIELADPDSWDQQVLVLALVDLLRRLLPCVEVRLKDDVAAHPALPPGPALLRERVDEVSAFGCEPGNCSGDAALAVVVGATGEGEREATAHVNGRGWLSYVGTTPAELTISEGANPIGPLTAACRAAAFVVNALIEGGQVLPASAYWDALTHAPVSAEPPTRDPAALVPRLDAVLMGCGSIGGAAAYAFARTPGLAGMLTLLDEQPLEPRNQTKAILARPDDIRSEQAKVDVAAAELAYLTPALEVDIVPTTLDQYVGARPREQTLPLVLCAVDSIESRRELQDSLPLEVVNAACDGTDVFTSGHVTDNGPCVYCLHIEQVLDAESARINILVGETGLPARTAAELIEKRSPLTELHLIGIERYRGLRRGALARYRGSTLEELFDSALRYGEQHLDLDEGTRAAIPAPFVTALAGFLLAGEALKARQDELAAHRLGPAGPGVRYYEAVGQPGGIVSNPLRFSGEECLCNDPRRLQILHERYQS